MTTQAKVRVRIMSEQDNKSVGRKSRDDGPGELWMLLKFLLTSGLLLSLALWPYTFGKLAAVWEPDVVKDIGVIKQLHYVGGFGISTQIDTEVGTFLIWDRVNLPRGTLLQARDSYFGRRICLANTKRCWDAARN